ncbi:MAG: intermembrane phospholipid transport protein YdbH family protein, partial [Candidatus Binatia bacterium]
ESAVADPAPSGGWPLMVQMTMSGERASPSRRFQLAIGAADPSAKAPRGGFSLRALVDAEPVPDGTRVTLRELTARDAALAMKADAVRRYAPKLPATLDGQIDTRLRALDASGRIDLREGTGSAFDGNVRLRDLNVHATGRQPFALEQLTIGGKVASPIDRFTPAAVELRDFTARLSSLRYGDNALEDFEASWRVEGRTAVADRFGFRIFGGRVSGAPAWNFATNAITRCDLAIQSIDVHRALANLSPENFDAEGRVSGRLHLLTDPQARLSGLLDLSFDGPGTLRIGEIEEVKQMLAGNFGLDLADLAMRDLRRYPFKEGRLSLESAGTNSELRLKFVRQPRTGADDMPPRKEIINGQEILVGSLVVPTIDMTIPITGKSLAEILTMVSGFRPLIEAVRTE